jgi:hypothetical protein
MRTLAVTLSLLFVLSACGKKDDPAPSTAGGGGTTASGSASDVDVARQQAGTVNGRCPVQTDQLVVADADTVTYKDPQTGKDLKVGFCCDKCPKQFQAEPEKYMARMREDPAKFGYKP